MMTGYGPTASGIVLRLIRLSFLLLLLCGLGAANATTILSVDMDQMLEQAKLVFEGEVLAHDVAWNANRSSISTSITFRVVDVIKGVHAEEQISVKFSGGKIGGEEIRVSAMAYPPIGEQGIYFLEDPSRHLVNPLIGWSQGHFVLSEDTTGQQRVLTANNAPVLQFRLGGGLVGNNVVLDRGVSAHPANALFSEGVARGLRVGDESVPMNKALSKSVFKQALRGRLSNRSNQANQ